MHFLRLESVEAMVWFTKDYSIRASVFIRRPLHHKGLEKQKRQTVFTKHLMNIMNLQMKSQEQLESVKIG